MSDLDDRFLAAVTEGAVELRELYPDMIEEAEWPQSHTHAYASGVSFALRVMSASDQLWELDKEKLPVPISPYLDTPDGPDRDLDPGFDRLCEIFVEMWEQHRRKLLDDFLKRLGE